MHGTARRASRRPFRSHRAESPETPPWQRADIQCLDHAGGAAEIEALFGVPSRLLRGGEGWTRETLAGLGTHNSTHVDAPYHYNSTVGVERAQTIDELPLDLFFAPGVVVDFTAKADGEAVTAEGMAHALDDAGHSLRERYTVLVRGRVMRLAKGSSTGSSRRTTGCHLVAQVTFGEVEGSGFGREGGPQGIGEYPDAKCVPSNGIPG